MHTPCVYILANPYNSVLYTGFTTDLAGRIAKHSREFYPGFSKKYQTKKLVYFEVFSDTENAIKREKRLKRWKREWKISLIEAQNPEWKALNPTA